MKPSIARQLFEEVAGSDEAAAIAHIEGFVNSSEKCFEGQHLEFKRGDIQKSDVVAKLWSKQLSAFANTGGGVVVWGIKTKKEDGGDYAESLIPAPDPLALKSQLESQLQHATDPPITGVEIRPVPSSGNPGYVVCYIPESTYKPHRAERCPGKPYFGRFSNRTDLIPTSWLRQLFYPERSLRLAVQFEFYARSIEAFDWDVFVTVFNLGPVTARDMCLQVVSNRACEFFPMWKCSHNGQRTGTREIDDDRCAAVQYVEYFCEMRTEEPLHPGNQVMPVHMSHLCGFLRPRVEIQVTIFAHNHVPVSCLSVVDESIYSEVVNVNEPRGSARYVKGPTHLHPITSPEAILQEQF